MKVEIWAEVTCPWCGFGSYRVDRAVERFEHADAVEVVHHSFPLGDSYPTNRTVSVREALHSRYGLKESQAETATRRIERMAAAEGLSPYRVLDNRVGNTGLAHEFLAHASAMGKNREAWHTIFDVYFGRAEPVFALPDLLTLADKLGLDREQTREALTDRRYRQRVRDDAERALRMGATGAPFIVVDGRYAVPGAQSSDVVLNLLRTAWDDTYPAITITSAAETPACSADGCAVPVHS